MHVSVRIEVCMELLTLSNCDTDFQPGLSILKAQTPISCTLHIAFPADVHMLNLNLLVAAALSVHSLLLLSLFHYKTHVAQRMMEVTHRPVLNSTFGALVLSWKHC